MGLIPITVMIETGCNIVVVTNIINKVEVVIMMRKKLIIMITLV